MRKRHADRAGAQRRLEAALDALHAAMEEPAEGDPVQAFFDGLLADLEGRVREANGEAKALNLLVRDFFGDVFLFHKDEGGVLVVPRFSGEAVQRIRRNRPGPSVMTSLPMFEAAGEERLDENARTPW
jgi:hypothetical protein